MDQHGQVLDVLLRDKRDRVSAEAFFRQALARTGVRPKVVVSDPHQPYVKAVAAVIPLARHVRTGLHRRCGETTQPVERRHVPTRDRLRGARGLKTVHTGQKFLESFRPSTRYDVARLNCALVPGYRPKGASVHETARAVVAAIETLSTHLKKAA